MAKFIMLKDEKGKDVFINFDLVTSFYISEKTGFIVLVFSENYVESVQSSVGYIVMMLK